MTHYVGDDCEGGHRTYCPTCQHNNCLDDGRCCCRQSANNCDCAYTPQPQPPGTPQPQPDVAAAREALEKQIVYVGDGWDSVEHAMEAADAYATAQAAAARAEAERLREILRRWERHLTAHPGRSCDTTCFYPAAMALAEAPAVEVHDA